MPRPCQPSNVFFFAVIKYILFIHISIGVLESKFTNTKCQTFIQSLINIGFYCLGIRTGIFIHMDGKHGIGKRIGIKNFLPSIVNRLRILTISSTINQNCMSQTRITNCFYCIFITAYPGIRIPAPIPFICYINNNTIFFTRNNIFQTDKVISCFNQ